MPRARPLYAAACCVAMLLGLAGCGTAGPRPGAAVPVLSNFERRTGETVSRDCGYSSPLPGRPGWSLWLFCDTQVLSGRASRQRVASLILGTDTAAAGSYRPGRVPGPLSEIPTPTRGPGSAVPPALPDDGAPAPFLPAPGGLTLPGGAAPCAGGGAYPAAWVSGVAGAPASSGHRLLVTYDDYCVTSFPGTPAVAEGFGIAGYDPSRGTLTVAPPVFGGGSPLPSQQTLGSPVLGRDGYLYLFGYGPGGVYLARVPAAPSFWQNPFAYQYLAGAGWSPSPEAARSLLPPGRRPLGVTAGDYTADGHGLVMIEQTSLAGNFTAWRASSPAGPWHRALSGQVPCTAGTGRQAGDLCRALTGHPELSTGDRLLLSFFDPGTGHVEVTSYPW